MSYCQDVFSEPFASSCKSSTITITALFPSAFFAYSNALEHAIGFIPFARCVTILIPSTFSSLNLVSTIFSFANELFIWSSVNPICSKTVITASILYMFIILSVISLNSCSPVGVFIHIFWLLISILFAM